MARLLGNPYGDMRGTIAGTTFSKSKTGSIARQYVKPVNSTAYDQIKQRQNFRSNAMVFKSIAGSDQANWNSFASLYFNPLRNTNHGQFSGYNSFVSCQNAVQSANSHYGTLTRITDVGVTNVISSQTPFSATFGAPEVSVQAMIHDLNPPDKPIS